MDFSPSISLSCICASKVLNSPHWLVFYIWISHCCDSQPIIGGSRAVVSGLKALNFHTSGIWAEYQRCQTCLFHSLKVRPWPLGLSISLNTRFSTLCISDGASLSSPEPEGFNHFNTTDEKQGSILARVHLIFSSPFTFWTCKTGIWTIFQLRSSVQIERRAFHEGNWSHAEDGWFALISRSVLGISALSGIGCDFENRQSLSWSTRTSLAEIW